MQANVLSQNDLYIISRAVARTWTDPNFKMELLANPKAVLAELDVTFPNGIEAIVSLCESIDCFATIEDNTLKIYLPNFPPLNLQDSDLDLDNGNMIILCYICCSG